MGGYNVGADTKLCCKSSNALCALSHQHFSHELVQRLYNSNKILYIPAIVTGKSKKLPNLDGIGQGLLLKISLDTVSIDYVPQNFYFP